MVPWDQRKPFSRRLGKGLADLWLAKIAGDPDVTVSLNLFGDGQTHVWKWNADGIGAGPVTFRAEWDGTSARLLIARQLIGRRDRP